MGAILSKKPMGPDAARLGLPIIREAWRHLAWDWPSVLLFSLCHQYLLVLLLPAVRALLGLSMKHTGGFLFLLAGLVGLLLLLGFCAYVEMGAVILYFGYARQGRKCGPALLLKEAVRSAEEAVRFQNASLLPAALALLPLTGIHLTTGPLENLQVPEFILEFLRETRSARLALLVLAVAAGVLLFRWIFVLPAMVLDGMTFPQARSHSRACLSGRRLSVLKTVVLGSAIGALAAILFRGGALALLLLSAKGLSAAFGGTAQGEALHWFWRIYPTAEAIDRILSGIWGMVWGLGLITTLYTADAGPNLRPPHRGTRLHRGGRLAFAFLLLWFLPEVPQNFLSQLPETLVFSHRAGGFFAPENTLAALAVAKEADAAYAEIDVRLLADGNLAVVHDGNFKRVTGADLPVRDACLGEVRSLDAGRLFSPVFAGEPVPTLEEMVDYADGQIGLMIELKGSGEGPLAAKTVEILRAGGFEDRCIIVSLHYSLLEQVKRIAPELKTAYITLWPRGPFENFPAADAWSIEETFVTASVIDRLHTLGKPVYAWTADSEKELRRLVELGVDGVVTNNPFLASYVIRTKGRDPLVVEIAAALLCGQ